MSPKPDGDLPFLERPDNLAKLEIVVRRVMSRLDRGEPAPEVCIPEEKGQFPKVLCLDQNKWIDLARAHYGRREGTAFVGALSAIREARSRGRLVVPILASNLAEVSEPADEGRRKRLAEFMVELSGNCSMVGLRALHRCEFRAALESMLLGRPERRCPRRRMVRWGIFAALGREPSSPNPLVQHALYEPEWAVLAMVDAIDRDTIEKMRSCDNQAAEVAIAARDAGLDIETRRRGELRALFESGVAAEDLYTVADELRIHRNALKRWLDDHLLDFAEAIPTIHVVNRLLLARDRSPDNRTHRNDLKDFTFLEVAIPYANLVVTEKSWAHLAHTERLDEHYRTNIIADARRLPEALLESGCL
jgi:hypothetical protein